MKIVLPFFYVIISIIAFLVLLTLALTIRLNIKEIKISNIENGMKKAKLKKTYNAFIELLIFGKIKIGKIKLDNKTLKRFKLEENIRTLNILKKLKVKVDMFNLDGEIGTENAMITAFIVATISSFLRYIT